MYSLKKKNYYCIIIIFTVTTVLFKNVFLFTTFQSISSSIWQTW